MDSFELNKIAGAVLGALLFVMGTGFLAELLVHSGTPATAGYDLPKPEPVAAAAPAAAPAAEPIAVRLASAETSRGEAAFKKCAACHSVAKGGASGIGPALWSVVQRPKAAHPGYAYSGPLAELGKKGEAWTYESLDQFVANPRGYVPGTKMAFAGIANPRERADLIAYLRTLADTPAPLPN